MASMLCRLCLNSDNVVDIFHPDLTNSERLRSCILLATGINISRDDVVTKHVCASCCDISVKLYKFRKNALANDRALKIQLKQSCLEAPAKVEDIVTTNKTIVEELSNRCNDPAPPPKDIYAVHPSVTRLFKSHQNLIISNELLRVNLDPRVVVPLLDEKDIPAYPDLTDATDPIDVFKATRPGINVNIVKVQNKRPLVEDEEEFEPKRQKIDDIPVVGEELPECLKDTQNMIVEPRTKPSTKVSYKIIDPEMGKENLDGSNKIVLARVTPKEPDFIPESDESSETSSTCSTIPANLPRKLLRPRKSRPSFFLSDYENDSDDDFLLETVEEELTYNCELCNKSFDHRTKLKLHMRCHKNCHVCKTVFRSSEALSYHQTNVCFKMLIANPPSLRLARCDDPTEIQVIKSQIPTIEFDFAETKHDDVLLISDDEEYDTVDGFQASEQCYTRALFKKYKSLRTPGSKLPVNHADKQIGTDSLSDAIIKLNKSQIIVEGMYASLQSLRVPVQLKVQEELAARLEPRKQESKITISETWSGKPKQLAKKPVVLNGLSTIPTIPLPTPVPRVYSYQKSPQNSVFITLNGPNQPAQLQSGGHSVPQMVQQAPIQVQMAGHSVPQMVPQAPMQFVSKQGYFQQVQYVAQPQLYGMSPQTVAVSQQSVMTHIPQKPDSNQQSNNAFLRVKAPWELNKM